jgi:hypothetical protein
MVKALVSVVSLVGITAAALLMVPPVHQAVASPPATLAVPVTEAAIEEKKEVPSEGNLNGYVVSQAPVITEAFCEAPGDTLAVFKLSKSAILTNEQIDGGGAVGNLAWTTLHADEYDWWTLDPSHSYFAFVFQRNATAALLIGELKGTCGSVPSIALAFDVDDESGQRLHYLIPLVIAPEVVIDTARLVPGPSWMALRAVAAGPCSGGTFCDDTYRQRMKTALNEFTQCMKGLVPPVTISSVACLIGCLPLMTGTPLLYAACVAGCTAITSLPGTAVDLTTCSNELEAETATAKASYCACLQYQKQNCPQLAEPENPANGGCP